MMLEQVYDWLNWIKHTTAIICFLRAIEITWRGKVHTEITTSLVLLFSKTFYVTKGVSLDLQTQPIFPKVCFGTFSTRCSLKPSSSWLGRLSLIKTSRWIKNISKRKTFSMMNKHDRFANWRSFGDEKKRKFHDGKHFVDIHTSRKSWEEIKLKENLSQLNNYHWF